MSLSVIVADKPTLDSVKKTVESIEKNVGPSSSEAVITKINEVDTKVTTIDTKVTAIDNVVNAVNTSVSSIDSKADTVNNKVDNMGNTVDIVNTNVNSLGAKTDLLAKDIASIKSSIEEGGGGGGGGGFTPIVNVTAPETTVVTCSNGVKTLTETATNGTCTFAIPSFGTWTFSGKHSTQSISPVTITITEIKVFEVTLKFIPQIKVTAPVGTIVTCKKGGTELTKTASSGSCTFDITENGEWTISGEYSGRTINQKTVTVNAIKTYPVTLELNPQINVTAPAGTIVTCKGTSTLTETAVSGSAKFNVPSTGNWAISGTYKGAPITGETINAKATMVYSTTLVYNPSIKVTAPVGCTVTCSSGSHTLTQTASNGTCTFNVTEPGTWTLVGKQDGKTSKPTNVVVSAVKVYNAEVRFSTTYGIRVDKQNANPKTRVEYTYDAVGMTPAHMDYAHGRFDIGSWADAWFVKGNAPVMLNYNGTEAYELDPNDYSKKKGGGPSDIANSGFAGNAMSRIPLCYLSMKEDARYEYYTVSDVKLDDSFIAIAHTKENGEIVDNIYLSIYKGSEIGGKIRSISGQYPIKNKNAQTELDYARGNGSRWCTRTHGQRQLVNALLKIMSKSTNSQEAFGRGADDCYNSGDSTNYGMLRSGTMNTAGQFFGYNDGKHDVKVFHMEGWWGNQWERIAGLMMNGKAVKVSYKGPYNITGAGYDTLFNITSNVSGFVKTNHVSKFGSIPNNASGGSDTTYECDQAWLYDGTYYALVGGNCGRGSQCGASCVLLDAEPSAADWHFGACLSFT